MRHTHPFDTMLPQHEPLPLWQNARRTDPATSKAAAASLGDMDTIFAALLAAYRNSPSGLTDEEASIATGIPYEQSHKRCSDLRKSGGIAVTGRVRLASTGRSQQVCIAT